MKIILYTFFLLVGAASLQAEQLRDVPVTEIIQQAVPALVYVAGDKSWSVGMFDNAYAGSVVFDANASFAVYRSQDPGLSASGAAKQVRDCLLKRFALPMVKPSSAWEKKPSPGLADGDSAEAYFVSYGDPSIPSSQRVLVSVQVTRRSPTEFGITVRYTTLSNLRA